MYDNYNSYSHTVIINNTNMSSNIENTNSHKPPASEQYFPLKTIIN